MRLHIPVALFLLATSACADTPMPDAWLSLYGDATRAIWRSYLQEGAFDFGLFIRDQRKLGSEHDGDRQVIVASYISVIEQDPADVFKALLESPDPHERAFVLMVIGHLADPRFEVQLNRLAEDKTELTKWELLHFKTVGDVARDVRSRTATRKPSVLVDEKLLAGWLKNALKQR
ncbi:MAG: hypothetical protein EOP84_08135 [Verrucomicrobiaceae bacterium]|nr:MAG: hypothetical protein EOP84_08135 [Verrucomicrobiaceae bacterium]